MATALSAPSADSVIEVRSDSLPVTDTPALAPPGDTHAVPARRLLRLGRTAAVSDGLSWPMLLLIGLFHAGALAALFLFSWQRLVVMAVIYVLAINVGIGMCYHRLLTHRGYQVPKWLEYVDDRLRHALARGRAHLLGLHASRPSPAQRPGRRSRTPRARADGGRTPAGFSSARRCTRRPRCWRATRPTCTATASTSG